MGRVGAAGLSVNRCQAAGGGQQSPSPSQAPSVSIAHGQDQGRTHGLGACSPVWGPGLPAPPGGQGEAHKGPGGCCQPTLGWRVVETRPWPQELPSGSQTVPIPQLVLTAQPPEPARLRPSVSTGAGARIPAPHLPCWVRLQLPQGDQQGRKTSWQRAGSGQEGTWGGGEISLPASSSAMKGARCPEQRGPRWPGPSPAGQAIPGLLPGWSLGRDSPPQMWSHVGRGSGKVSRGREETAGVPSGTGWTGLEC